MTSWITTEVGELEFEAGEAAPTQKREEQPVREQAVRDGLVGLA
jgi:hypothetical protein